METHIIEMADLAELLDGNRVAVGGIWLVLDAKQLDTALGVLRQYRDGEFTVPEATTALRKAGINLSVKKD